MANTKITSRVIADNSVGIDALNVTDGTNGQALVTDGSGGLSFASVGVSGIDSSADATAITISSAEKVFIGHTAAVPIRTIEQRVQISGVDQATSGLSLARYQDGAFAPGIHLAKSRNATVGSHTIVQDGDRLGDINFYGSDGTDFSNHAATIMCEVDGTPGNDDTPGRLTFHTTADGSGAATERMRITSTGALRHTQSGYTFDNGFRQGDGTNYWQSTMGGDNAYYFGSYNGGSGARIDPSTGDFRLQGGIQFNADSAAANALDDYEEGTWTPALYTYSGVTTTSISTYGIYTKIGNICHIHAKISATLSSLPGQTFTITGLPFTATNSSDTGQRAIITIGGDCSNTGAAVNGRAHFRTNGTELQGVYLNSGSTVYWTYNTMDSSTFDLNIHGFYTTT